MKIRRDNAEELQSALDSVQANSKVRNITLIEIGTAIEMIEVNLAQHRLAKKLWVGLKYTVNPCAQGFVGSSFGLPAPDSTQFTVERFESAWFITSIERASCGNVLIALESPLQDHQIDCLAESFSKSFEFF